MEIIVTVGPSSIEFKTLKSLRRAGATSFRLNLSHLNQKTLENYLEVFDQAGIIPSLDTQGAQARIVNLEHEIDVKEGENVLFTCEAETNKKYPNIDHTLQLNHQEAIEALEKDDIVKVDFDGLIIKIKEVSSCNTDAMGIAMNTGKVNPNRAVDISNKSITLNSLSKFDKYAITKYSGLINELYLSFTNNKEDIINARTLMKESTNKKNRLVAKVETKMAILNMAEIVKEADSILIDRGDLSRELSMAKIPGATHAINKICKNNETPFYVATNILDTMMKEKLPSRSELSDIYNMMIQGVDGIVLAAEVAIGKNPVDSVRVIKYMSKITNIQKENLAAFISEEDLKKNLPIHLAYWL